MESKLLSLPLAHLELKLLQPAAVRHVWHTIRPGLDQIVRKTSPKWCPEDIYVALQTNRAALYLAMLGRTYEGFVVVSVVDDQF